MHRTRRQFLGAIAASGVGLSGCAGDDGSGGQPQATATETQGSEPSTVVEMVDTAFDPVRISVAPGATVGWVNRDGFEHDVTAAQFHDVAADWSYSRTLAEGQRASHTFDAAGIYEYSCTIHGEGTMCGAVLVGDASLSASLPCESGGSDGGGGDDDGGYY